MRQTRWLRFTALALWLVSGGCGGDDSDGEGTGDEGDPQVDAGGSTTNPATGGGGAAAAGDAGAAQPGAPAQDVFLRVDTFELKAPELVLRVLGVETSVTSDVQGMLDTSLSADAEPKDGFVDLNMLLRFSGASDPAKGSGKATFGGARCPHPVSATKACSEDQAAPFFEPAVSYENASSCELEGGDAVSGACFKTSAGRLAVMLPLFGPVVLDDAQVIGAWVGGGKDGVAKGVIRGFVSEQTAKTTTIQGEVPAHLALFDIKTGAALTTFLPQTQETGPRGAGWSFRAQFTAKPARFE